MKASDWYNSVHGKEIKIRLILLHIYRILEIRIASHTIYRTQLTCRNPVSWKYKAIDLGRPQGTS